MGLPVSINPSDVDFKSIIKPSSHGPLVYPLSQFIGNEPSRYLLTTKQSYHLLGFHFDKLTFNRDYFIAITTRNTSGHPLTVSAFDDNNHYKFFYSKLPSGTSVNTTWFYLPKMESDNFNEGLTILFNNPSFNTTESINEIISLEVYPSNQEINNRLYETTPITPTSSSSQLFIYKTTSPVSPASYITLHQSFSKGWIAFYINSGKLIFLDNHIKANGWANGWQVPPNLDSSTPIYIIFWPQLLEFIGLALIPLTFLGIAKIKK
jgi:hypothetical protein